jgi:Ni/Fe-hydrogenase 1 B-type cytochrome subunit
MDNILSVQQPESLFRTGYTLAIRLWHWLTFLTTTASILMVIFASTVFTMKDNIPMVQEQLQQKGATVTAPQARSVAHEYNDKLWNLHKYIGFGICFLLLCRLLIEVSYSKERRLGSKIKKALAFQAQSPTQQYDRKHYLLVKRGYIVFYVLITLMALTGLGMAFEDVPFLRSIRPALTSIHKIGQFLIYAYAVAHIVGVIRADVTDNRGIVSAMINGGVPGSASESA